MTQAKDQHDSENQKVDPRRIPGKYPKNPYDAWDQVICDGISIGLDQKEAEEKSAKKLPKH